MLRGTLTLLSRSIRADAQQKLPHAFRIGSVLFILVFLVVAQISASESELSAPGLDFFLHLSFLMIGLITLAGMGHFANAITEEKEEGTLGLLLLADISPLSILLGKSTNRILSAWLIFLAQFPFALLALTLGGITVAQIIQVYLSLGAYLFLIANMGLLFSVLSQRTGIALAAMGVLSLLLHGFVPWLSHLVSRMQISDDLARDGLVASWMESLQFIHEDTSVIFEVLKILDPAKPAALLSLQVLSHLLVGCLLFFLSWLCFRRIVWAPDSSNPPRGVVPSTSSRLISVIPRVWKNSLIWKDFHFLAGGPLVFLGKAVLFPIFIAASYRYAGWLESASGLSIDAFVRGSVLVVLMVEVLMYSSNLFHTEKKWGTLPTLLMLPKSVSNLGYSKVVGCMLGSLPTLLAFFAVTFWDPGSAKSGIDVLISWEILIGLCSLVLLCQLTVLCSLIVKWGALPLAVAFLLVMGVVLIPVVKALMIVLHEGYRGADYVQIGPIIYTTAIISAVLQIEIGRRIHLSAAN